MTLILNAWKGLYTSREWLDDLWRNDMTREQGYSIIQNNCFICFYEAHLFFLDRKNTKRRLSLYRTARNCFILVYNFHFICTLWTKRAWKETLNYDETKNSKRIKKIYTSNDSGIPIFEVYAQCGGFCQTQNPTDNSEPSLWYSSSICLNNSAQLEGIDS